MVTLTHPELRPAAGRAALVARLCASRVPCVSLIAPAGYGKTTLIAEWAEADPRPFIWAALDDPLSLEGVLRGQPMVVVVDNVHATGDPSRTNVLAGLVEDAPSGSQIVLAGREQPALPFARWRGHGMLLEVGVADLRLDANEASALLRAAGSDLEAPALTALLERTEGWPVGLNLAALGHRDGDSGVAGDDRFVSEYLRKEVLSALGAEARRFLLRTSVLDRMCGGLCDAVLGSTGSVVALEALERTNGFVVPLDRCGRWYRLHTLFGEFLRHELQRTAPEVIPELNRRAMKWCLENDLREAAVEYGLAAGETETVAGLIDELATPLYYDGRFATLERWLNRFAEAELERYPALAVHGARLRALSGRPADAQRWLGLAGDGGTAATLRAHMMPAGPERALADADLALEQLEDASDWVPCALLARGVTHATLGATERAGEDLAAAIELGLAAGAFEDVFLAQAELALLAAGRGAWGEAGRRARAAQALVDETGLDDRPTSALALVALARVALHGARIADARAALARVHRLRPQLDHGVPWLSLTVGLELTRAHLALGEASAAGAVLADAEQVLALRPDMGGLAVEVRTMRERLRTASTAAGAWAMSLTGAELRLLPYLATHLTFPEIAGRLFISRNTVKSEAVSIYRKLGASSRSEAIDRAVEVGLLEASVLPRPDLIPRG